MCSTYRGYDLSMKHVFNGKERDADEWANLLAQVDPRLKLQSIKSPPKSMLFIIEIVLEEPRGKLSETTSLPNCLRMKGPKTNISLFRCCSTSHRLLKKRIFHSLRSTACTCSVFVKCDFESVNQHYVLV